MLLAVFSDSHGTVRHMADAVAEHRPDCVIFLGDGVRDAERVKQMFPETRFIILRGNCDREPGYEDRALLRLEGVGIFAAHGHEHGVRYGMDKFCTSVLCSGSALGLYGHTHRPMWQEVRGMQIVNPGSIGSAQHPTFALVRIEEGKADVRILDAPNETGGTP
jgi:putative phosphoesterase